MKPLRILVAGSSGRMGAELLQLIHNDPKQFQLAAALSLGSPQSLADMKAADVDVMVDFSSPDYLMELITWAKLHKKPLVSGTTGLSEAHRKALQSAAEQSAILYAPNMSLGVAVINEMLHSLGLLKDYDFAVEELHHRHKKDAPSGTALHLQRTLDQATGQSSQMVSLRGGGIFGVHRVLAMSAEDTITIEHVALNRTVFARGALQAAQWLAGQGRGMYTLRDVLGLGAHGNH